MCTRAAAQRKFLDLGGSAENQGDLRSVVLHKMTLGAQKSTFPIALGVRITGVDDKAFSQTGESYSMITMPNADSHQDRVLQEDNTELAYEFARKFPGYTAENLDTKGIHEARSPSFNHSSHCVSFPHLSSNSAHRSLPVTPLRMAFRTPCLALFLASLIAHMRSLGLVIALMRASRFASHVSLLDCTFARSFCTTLRCTLLAALNPGSAHTSRLRARDFSDLAQGIIASDLALRISGVYSLPFWPPSSML